MQVQKLKNDYNKVRITEFFYFKDVGKIIFITNVCISGEIKTVRWDIKDL